MPLPLNLKMRQPPRNSGEINDYSVDGSQKIPGGKTAELLGTKIERGQNETASVSESRGTQQELSKL